MKKQFIINLRLFLAELALKSNILSNDIHVENILVNYDDNEILEIVNKLESQNEVNNLQEFLGLVIIGVISLITYIKTKAEKARKELFDKQFNTCNHLTGKMKKTCFDDLRIKANLKKLNVLKDGMKKCDQIKDSYKCKKLLKVEIDKLSKKVKL